MRVGQGHRGAAAGALAAKGLPYSVDEGGGAFYGPKIDVKLRDSDRPGMAVLDHPAGLQPARAFRRATYVAEDGSRQTPDHAAPGAAGLH